MTRNEILEIVKQFYENNVTEREVAFARFVMAIEREACADLCYKTSNDNAFVNHYNGTRMDLRCSELIRARGEK